MNERQLLLDGLRAVISKVSSRIATGRFLKESEQHMLEETRTAEAAPAAPARATGTEEMIPVEGRGEEVATPANWPVWPMRARTNESLMEGEAPPELTVDGDYVLYHGTTGDVASTLSKTGLRRDNIRKVGVSTTLSDAKVFAILARQKRGGTGVVIRFVVDAGFIRGETITREGNHKNLFLLGSAVPPDKIKSIVVIDPSTNAPATDVRLLGTKAVDESGDPATVFHGTASKAEAFQLEDRRGIGGIFFTRSREVAQKRAEFVAKRDGGEDGEPRVVEARVNIQNPAPEGAGLRKERTGPEGEILESYDGMISDSEIAVYDKSQIFEVPPTREAAAPRHRECRKQRSI